MKRSISAPLLQNFIGASPTFTFVFYTGPDQYLPHNAPDRYTPEFFEEHVILTLSVGPAGTQRYFDAANSLLCAAFRKPENQRLLLRAGEYCLTKLETHELRLWLERLPGIETPAPNAKDRHEYQFSLFPSEVWPVLFDMADKGLPE